MTPPRRPLVPPPTELERELLLLAEGLDENGVPLGSTDAEKQAAANPGLADPNWKEKPMEPLKAGYRTSEFWLKAAVLLLVVPVLVFFQGGGPLPSPLPDMAADASTLHPLLALAMPVLLKAVGALIAWATVQLAGKYGDNRTSLKIAAIESNKAA